MPFFYKSNLTNDCIFFLNSSENDLDLEKNEAALCENINRENGESNLECRIMNPTAIFMLFVICVVTASIEGDSDIMERAGKGLIFNQIEKEHKLVIPLQIFLIKEEVQTVLSKVSAEHYTSAETAASEIEKDHEEGILQMKEEFMESRRAKRGFLSKLKSSRSSYGKIVADDAESLLSSSVSFGIKKESSSWKSTLAISSSTSVLAVGSYHLFFSNNYKKALEVISNATSYNDMKTTLLSTLTGAANNKLGDVKMLLFNNQINHLSFVMQELRNMSAGYTEVQSIDIENDNIIISMVHQLYDVSGELMVKNDIGSLLNQTYTWKPAIYTIGKFIVDGCKKNIFDNYFCYKSSTKLSSSNTARVDVCFQRVTLHHKLFIAVIKEYYNNETKKVFPNNGILVLPRASVYRLIIPGCGTFASTNITTSFTHFQKKVHSDSIQQLEQELKKFEEDEKNAILEGQSIVESIVKNISDTWNSLSFYTQVAVVVICFVLVLISLICCCHLPCPSCFTRFMKK